MKALDGPFEGKEYIGITEQTHTLIDNYRTEYDFYSVTYKRTDAGWKFEKQESLSPKLPGISFVDPFAWSRNND